jgi:hypothetical protein
MFDTGATIVCYKYASMWDVTPFGTFGEFRVPNIRDLQPNEEQTATGIVIGRNLDDAGSLKGWLLEHETVTNRARLPKELKPTPEHRLRIASKTPWNELLLPVPVLDRYQLRPITSSEQRGCIEPPSEPTGAEIEAPEGPTETFVPLEEGPELEVSTVESADGFSISVLGIKTGDLASMHR